MALLVLIRTVLYSVFAFWALLTFILAAAFVGQTNKDGLGYSQSAAELIAAGILGLATLPVLHFLFHRRANGSILSSILVELIAVSVIWLLFLGGAAAISNDVLPFVGSRFCDASFCHLGQATAAFAWLSWITLTALLGLVLFDLIYFSIKSKAAWKEPFAAHAAAGTTKGEAAPAQGTAEMTQQQPAVHV
ncbi:hypothetical protein BCR35DRAFT_300408 [Leucosporidium creatinivorum]|uniref:MARVEL domain-containing protein n=1 Tax=Leucosporidium creatinivorum TaxID=106004 RepID=A0A1Y2G0N9_9BASI|nr:hypothetical protein BCR35DRAFT_300408 [Leucosporidium creatinivorum]